MSQESDSTGPTRPSEPTWNELGKKLLLVAVIALHPVLIAAILLSESALHWLGNLPFLGGIMDGVGPFLTTAAFVQVVLVVTYLVTHLLLNIWQNLTETHGGPKPSVPIAAAATVALIVVFLVFVPHGKSVSLVTASVDPPNRRDAPQQVPENHADTPTAPETSGVSDREAPQPRLPAVYRLQRSARGPAPLAQRFVVGADVTAIELVTPVAYASFKDYTLILDGKESQGYQIRTGELSLVIDRQNLPPGTHTLEVNERQNGSSLVDVQTFKFVIIDGLR